MLQRYSLNRFQRTFLKNNSVLRSYFNLNRFQEIGCNYTLHLFTSINIVYLSNFRSPITAQFSLPSTVVTVAGRHYSCPEFICRSPRTRKQPPLFTCSVWREEKIKAPPSTLRTARRVSHMSIRLLHFLLNK